MGLWLEQPPSIHKISSDDDVLENSSPERDLELWACVALNNASGLGGVGRKTLHEKFGSALQAAECWQKWPEVGIREHVAQEFGKRSWLRNAENEWRALARYTSRFLLFNDAEYPACLRNIPDAPLVLFYEGKLQFLRGPALAVVGSRKCSPDGVLACRTLCRELSDAGVTVVSGLAFGIDSEAHKAAVDGPGGTIAIMGTGLERTYPAQNHPLRTRIAEKGMIITEYPPQSRLAPQNFPKRNRIIMGLSLGVLVVEASNKSGSLITARLAGENGRMVYAVPGRFGSPLSAGCARLIRNGATPVFDVSDILWDLQPHLQAACASWTESTEAGVTKIPAFIEPSGADGDISSRLISFLRENGPTHVDSIGASLGLAASEVSSSLLILEVSGVVKCFPGMVYGAVHDG